MQEESYSSDVVASEESGSFSQSAHRPVFVIQNLQTEIKHALQLPSHIFLKQNAQTFFIEDDIIDKKITKQQF